MLNAPIDHWYGVCERTGLGMFAEPLNVLSSFFFIFVAVSIYRYYRNNEDLERKWIWDIHFLTANTLFIGISSTIFHSFPTPVTEAFDEGSIVVFIIVYFWSVLFRIGRCTPFQAAVCFIAFTGFSYTLVHQFPHSLNDSIGYLSSMTALIMIAVYLHLKARPSSQYFMLAAIIGVVSLFCRAVDRAVCPMFPFGTHFLWHTFNATLLYILLKQIIRNVNREARLMRMAGDSTMI